MSTHEALTLSVTIARDRDSVYDFLCEPTHLPRWASGLCHAIRPDGDAWLAEGPSGPVVLRFTPRNPFGVLDHTVHPAPDETIAVPMRVIANGDGAEVLLTLFRLPGMSDAQFAADARWIERDLAGLKALLEN